MKSPGFADAMGLAGTQQNARDALDQSFATTTKFGESAAEITKQLNELAAQAVMTYLTGVPMLGGAQKAKESIGKDAAAGRITADQAQRSIAKVNDAMADSLGVGQFRSVLEHPEVAAAVSTAAERGAPLSVAKGDTRVEVGPAPSLARKDVSPILAGWSLPWPFRLFSGRKAVVETSAPSSVGQWIAKDFDIVSLSDPRRIIRLVLSMPNNRWFAVDPRGIIDPHEGTWQSNNYVNTRCQANGKLVIDMVGCGIANVEVGQNGAADVGQSGDSFTWSCTKIVYDKEPTTWT